jgi:hypothetical protein
VLDPELVTRFRQIEPSVCILTPVITPLYLTTNLYRILFPRAGAINTFEGPLNDNTLDLLVRFVFINYLHRQPPWGSGGAFGEGDHDFRFC